MQKRILWLRGPAPSWDTVSAAAVALCVAVALWLRLHDLGAEGFADDEVHKWLAAHRYLRGSFSGDDAEHPMLMKWLITACIAALPREWGPEMLTRLPNALAGGVSVWLTAELGRRLFGRVAAVFGCALAAVSPTLIGYQRIAKEDTLVGVFVLLLLWCMAEAAALDSRKWEVGAALSLAGLLASKYYPFAPVLPLVVWLVLRDQLRVPVSRWAALTAIAVAAWLAVNWTPLLPETWAYLKDHLAGRHVATPSLYFMGAIYQNLPLALHHGVPPWFFLVFTWSKLTPLVLVLSLAGIAVALRRRAPAERVALAWLGFWLGVWMFSGGKYGRYFLPALPALFLFAGHAVAEGVRHAKAVALAGALAVAGEAAAAVTLAPHYRLYVSPLAGGEANLDWLFPHCDWFDAGFREAVEQVAMRAEPRAELTSEIDLPAAFYAQRAGRKDLDITVLRDGCRGPSPCYVIMQPGRIYAGNVAVFAALKGREPWHVEHIRGHAAATVYRLAPGEPLFDGPERSSARE